MVDLTELIIAILGVAGALITLYLIPYIKERYSAEKINQVQVIISAFVKAAEMIYNGDGRGEEKKAYVMKRAQEYLEKYHIKIDFKVVEDMIESAVLDMNNQLKK